MTDEDKLRPGDAFGRYQIIRLIGEGGMGVVFEAIHPGLKKRFAVKTLLPSAAESPEVRARFLREGEAASRIRHPNVVDVVDVGTEDDVPFLVMEFLEGKSLSDLLRSQGQMALGDAIDIFLPVLSAVAAGHAQGVVHRDLKPSNVFVSRGPWGEPLPKVLDFGVSKLLGDIDRVVLTGTETVLGTAAYMSPEQAMGARQVDARSDQFSLGLILYEMLCGQRAHPGENQLEILHNVTSGFFIPPRRCRADLPGAIESVLLRMLALNPADRYPLLQDIGRPLLPFAGKKVRLTLATAFSDSPAPAARGLAAALLTGGGAVTPASAREAVRSSLPNAATTFHHSAAEITPKPRPVKSWGKLFAGGVALALVAGAAFVGTRANRPPVVAPAALSPARAAAPPVLPSPPSPHPRYVEVRALPAEATLAFDGQPTGNNPLSIARTADDRATHTLRVSATGYQPKELSFGPETDPPQEIALDPVPTPRATKHATGRRHDTGKPHVPGASHVAAAKTAEGAAASRQPDSGKDVDKDASSKSGKPRADIPKRGVNNAYIIH